MADRTPGFFDVDDRLAELSAKGDDLERVHVQLFSGARCDQDVFGVALRDDLRPDQIVEHAEDFRNVIHVRRRAMKLNQIQRFNDRTGLKTMAQFADLDVFRRSRLKKSTLFEMEDAPGLAEVQAEYLRLAAALWQGTDPLIAEPLKDRDIFDLLGFD